MGTDCELSGTPIFIDGRVPCHCCGRPVKVRMVDGLWCYVAHDPDAAGNGEQDQ